MFPSPFGPKVSFIFLDNVDGHELHPDEAALLSANAGAKRIKQFTLGRAAANQALRRLGFVEPPPVLRSTNRAPLWPEGVKGSITHAGEYAAAAAAYAGDVKGIGIDMEEASRVISDRLAETFCSAEELRWVRQTDTPLRSLLIFSAKESIYKALYPRYEKFFGYDAVSLRPPQTSDVSQDEGVLEAVLKLSIDNEFSSGTTFSVGWLQSSQFIFTWTLLDKVMQ